MLEVRDLVAGYRRAPVVGPLSFSLERGEVLIFVGPNGAGKSTLFRTLATLQKPLAGKVFLDGDPLERKADRVFFLGERVEMPESLTGAEYLRVVSSLYGETADPEPYLRYAGCRQRRFCATSPRGKGGAFSSRAPSSCLGPSSTSSTILPSASTTSVRKSSYPTSYAASRRRARSPSLPRGWRRSSNAFAPSPRSSTCGK